MLTAIVIGLATTVFATVLAFTSANAEDGATAEAPVPSASEEAARR